MPSSAIRYFSYETAKRELLVTFTTGRSYVYFDVPADVDAAFKAAASKGTFFNTQIRDRFAFRERERIIR